MKPLLMMRTKGLTGPAFAKHAGCSRLSKSVGNQIWPIAGPTIDLDGDGLPDHIISEGPPLITEDGDSINVDVDGDGDADIIFPK